MEYFNRNDLIDRGGIHLSRLQIMTPDRAQMTVEGLYRDVERRIVASPPGLCPVDMLAAFLKTSHAQSCGKCVPCRIGLGQLEKLLDDVLDGRASMEDLATIERTARAVALSADCAIGYEAAEMVLKGLAGFREDFVAHITENRCLSHLEQPVPCVAMCPAGVDVPGYIALVAEGRFADAVRLIRKDNPFPAACAFVCEHPCEARCRRNMVDDAVNIRGLKRYAVDHAGQVPIPPLAEATGKKVAVIGGGPSGMSAAYYLALMGHEVTIFEQREELGGMLRYGIPSYRLPRERLDEELASILSAGIKVHCNVTVGKDIMLHQLNNDYDAVYVSIGAHTDKKLGIAGENSRGVLSAVEMLRTIGDEEPLDLQGKQVAVIGGGNVAMDVARSAKRLGAAKVTVIYRRRQEDMTALPQEVEGAIAEGCELLTLSAPVRLEADGQGDVQAVWVQPQIIGQMDAKGRPRPLPAQAEEVRIACDRVIVAIGQDIESGHFAEYGLPVKRGTIEAMNNSGIASQDGLFAGGDCVSGPASAIKAIASGKVAAANIDAYLGYEHIISVDVDIPQAQAADRPPCGRVNMKEREAGDRATDFGLIEYAMSAEEAAQEASRCLRCDHFGYGAFKGGRVSKW